MKIIEVKMFKVPDFLIPALEDGDITDFTSHDESILKTANEEFEELCCEGEHYLLSKVKAKQKPYTCDKPDFTKHKCNVYDLLLTIYK